MRKADAQEAAPIMQRSLQRLLAVVPRSSPAMRTACYALIAKAEMLIQSDMAGPPLIACFDLAVASGATQPQLDIIRAQVLAETVVSLGATMIRDSIMELAMACEGQVISTMAFTSRSDVEALLQTLNPVFHQVEETAADAMDQMTFQALVQLHAAIIYHLTQSARPLPRMVTYAFAQVMPSLAMANRLYYDASRADELRDENKNVHPAFMLPTGRALSF